MQLAGEPEVLEDEGTYSRSAVELGLAMLPVGFSKLLVERCHEKRARGCPKKRVGVEFKFLSDNLLNSVSHKTLLKIS